jgi:phage replication O-like protein O
MASPQKEDGYTPIANEIMDALCKTRIPGEERQVLDAILRKTYGWQKTSDKISMGQIAAMTGMKRQNVNRAIRSLSSKMITRVIKSDDRGINLLEFNKNYEQWQGVIKNDYSIKCNQKRLQRVIKTDDRSVIKSDSHKRKERKLSKESVIVVPDRINPDLWNAFLEMRKSIKKPAGSRAQELLIKKLLKLGGDPNAIIEQSIMNSWQGFFEVKEGTNANFIRNNARNWVRREETLSGEAQRAFDEVKRLERERAARIAAADNTREDA